MAVYLNYQDVDRQIIDRALQFLARFRVPWDPGTTRVAPADPRDASHEPAGAPLPDYPAQHMVLLNVVCFGPEYKTMHGHVLSARDSGRFADSGEFRLTGNRHTPRRGSIRISGAVRT